MVTPCPFKDASFVHLYLGKAPYLPIGEVALNKVELVLAFLSFAGLVIDRTMS